MGMEKHSSLLAPFVLEKEGDGVPKRRSCAWLPVVQDKVLLLEYHRTCSELWQW